MILDTAPIAAEFKSRMDAVDDLIQQTDGSPVDRQARGLAVVLIFAAYEYLLTALTRAMIEAAMGLNVGNRSLKPAFLAIALKTAAQSIHDASDHKILIKGLPALIERSSLARSNTLDSTVFPSDGSFMKQSQVKAWCDFFSVGDPGQMLKASWSQIDGLVANRNGVAHGRLRADEVGRSYSVDELKKIAEDWRVDWLRFLASVEGLASSRDFYRYKR